MPTPSTFATIGEDLAEAEQRRKMIGRLATYLQMYVDLMVRTNDWDAAVLRRFRKDAFIAGFHSVLDGAAPAELAHVVKQYASLSQAPA